MSVSIHIFIYLHTLTAAPSSSAPKASLGYIISIAREKKQLEKPTQRRRFKSKHTDEQRREPQVRVRVVSCVLCRSSADFYWVGGGTVTKALELRSSAGCIPTNWFLAAGLVARAVH